MKKYLRKVSEYIANVDDIHDKIEDVVYKSIGGTSQNFDDFITNIILDYLYKYSDLEYRFIPMELSDDIEKDFEKVMSYFYFKLRHRKYLFDKANEVADSYEINIPSSNKNTIEYDTTTINDRNGVKTDTYGKTINKELQGLEYRASDDAPITSDITVLDTPSQKNKISSNSRVTDTHGGIDTTEDEWTLNQSKNGTDKNETVSPELFKNFVLIAEEYNIYNLLETVIRAMIYEFNMVM